MTVLIGTSGWQYDDWRGTFYPADLPQRRWLPHYGEHFQTVEVNATFYRLPSRDTVAEWARATPDDFTMTVKASRYLTHVKRLQDPGEPVERLLEVAGALDGKLGPVLLQLPPTLQADLERLDATLAAFAGRARVAVEPRHDSWWTDEVRELLASHGAALCWADRDSRLITPSWRTADWGFIRFHAGRAQPRPCYGRGALDSRATLLAKHFGADATVFAYFNNDTHCCAVRDARRFALACRHHGLKPSRVPASRQVQLAASAA